jgi:single-strand DNA-binding protein
VNKTGEKVNDTHWHNIVAWNKTADIIEKFVTKGNKVGIEGKLTSRSWDDKDGTKRYITEVLCNEVLLLSPKES